MSQSEGVFNYGTDPLTASIALKISRGTVNGIINKEVQKKIQDCQQVVSEIVDDEKTVYGINTGFGSLCSTKISKEDTQKLQDNILRSHSVGVGEIIPEEITCLMIILKVHSLSFGYSGISLEVINRLIWFLDHNITPLVPSKGSLGASGDLAPLAHLFLPLIGLGKVKINEVETDILEIYKKENLAPIILGPKEGLALINGTQFIASFCYCYH